MAKVHLTDKAVRELEGPAPGQSVVEHWDDELTGFGLRVSGGGKRVWFVRCRVGTKQLRVPLGTIQELTAGKARKKASDALAERRLGIDPTAATKARKAEASKPAALTVGGMVDAYLKAKKREQKPRTFAETERHLRKHAATLHKAGAAAVSRANIAALLGRIEDASGPVAANRVRASLSACYGWAISEGSVDSNPVVRTRKREEKPRERVLSGDELRAIWSATEKVTDYHTIVRLLLLTGQRREEIAAMRRSEIAADVSEGTLLSLPSERTKNGQPHYVPLSAAALVALARHPEPEPDEGTKADGEKVKAKRGLVFGRGEGGYSGWSRSKAQLDANIARANANAAGRDKPTDEDRPKPWTLHDLRRTMATVMNERDLAQPHIVEAVLNHISGHKGGVAGVYNRATYAAEKRAALDRWAAWLMEAVGETEAKAGNVVELKRRA